LVQDKDQI